MRGKLRKWAIKKRGGRVREPEARRGKMAFDPKKCPAGEKLFSLQMK